MELNLNFDFIYKYNIICTNSQCNKGQARAQNFFSSISINVVPKVV